MYKLKLTSFKIQSNIQIPPKSYYRQMLTDPHPTNVKRLSVFLALDTPVKYINPLHHSNSKAKENSDKELQICYEMYYSYYF